MKIKFYYVFRALILICIAIAMIYYTSESLESAKVGFKLWAEVVFPSLLPFFIITDLLISYGIINFLGYFLEPLAKRLFNVNGVGGVVFFLAIAAGFPSGAKMAVKLYENGEITKDEAERIAAFCNFSSPLFILGAVGVGMFSSYKIGILLMIIHYVSNALVGITLGIFSKKIKERNLASRSKKIKISELFFNTAKTNKKPFGTQMGESVTNSIEILLSICGFLVLFAVLNTLLNSSGIVNYVAIVFEKLLNISPAIIQDMSTGLLEVTIGVKAISISKTLSIFAKICIASMLLGFNGFSVHSQIASILNPAGLSYKPFLYARILQALYSIILVLIFWKKAIVNYLAYDVQLVYFPLLNDNTQSSSFDYLKLGAMITFFILFYYCYNFITKNIKAAFHR
ncbi:MAG: sporulation integral rane protein YlbJ [Bacillales bacterium]|jgi:sporulation integral membrane protein YlbJ|nr:sporulation integral rane protein YlbJ [Bacillales bacterium]